MNRLRTLFAAAAIFVSGVVIGAHVVERAGATLPLPGINGPSLGDTVTNLFTLTQSYVGALNLNFSPAVVAGPAATQATCFAIFNPHNNVITSAANGALCLPTAFAGRDVLIGNASGQTLNIFGSNQPFVPGVQDTINGTTGSTAYASVITGKNAECFAPANGVWYCSAGN